MKLTNWFPVLINGGINFMKKLKTFALAFFLLITPILFLEHMKIVTSEEELREDMSNLEKVVASLEKDLENSSNKINELMEENKRIIPLEDEIASLKTSVKYQDFKDSISTIETYKKTKKFNELSELVALVKYSSYTTDKEGNCPCGMVFNEKTIEWKPNQVLELSEFRFDTDRIYLTFNTVQSIDHNYQFVMIKSRSMEDAEELWRIEEIKLVEKES